MSILKYNYNSQRNLFVSTHFQVKEFASIGNGNLYTTDVLIDEYLIACLERIFNKLNATKAIISSGYRNAQCDKAVGGSGVGQHVNGRAVDICYYDKSGKPIPSKIVACVAYDMNELNGIAPIDANYIHLDNRQGSTYHGDEARGNSSYWSNPYLYFKVSSQDVAKYTGQQTSDAPTTSNGGQYQSHGLGKKWYPNVRKGDSGNYAGVFGVSMDGVYIDNAEYRVQVAGNRWLPAVIGRNDYAGILGQPITGIAIKGATYRVHNKTRGYWLPWVTGYDINNKESGYAGNGSVIDAIQIK